jgi:uncharacterized membrane protein YeaQ/YmgE (transglycosylase-associated protein family)
MDTVFQIISWIAAGAIAGWLASVLLRAQRQGCLINIGIGIAGAFVGGIVKALLFPYFSVGIGFLDTLISAIIGSVVLLIVAELVLPGKQLGTRRRETRRRRRN